jgi:hypothetical protein
MTDAQTFTITVVTNAATTPVSLVPAGSTWRYWDNGSDPGTSWRYNGFNDGTWLSGMAPLGYGQGDEATTVGFGPNAANKFITTCFRRPFHIPEASFVQSLTGRMVRDAGAVVFLNGTEIWRDNLPSEGLSYFTMALGPLTENARTNFLTRNLNAALLVTGSNMLAAEIHQASPEGATARFDFDLSATALVPSQTILNIRPSTSGAILAWPVDSGLYHLYTTTNLCPGTTWIRATNTPVLSNDFWVVALPAGTNQTQFYRLQTP